MPARPDAAPVARRNASAECEALLHEVSAREAQQAAVLGRWHQMTVDAYTAQHVGPMSPRIGPAFALIGLYLALERGLDGLQVRDAHGFLARTKHDWPAFEAPAHSWPMTVFDIAIADGPMDHAEAVRRWGASVWDAWTSEHARVRALADPLLAQWAPRSGS